MLNYKTILIVFIVTGSYFSTYSQWILTDGLFGEEVLSLTTADNFVLAGSDKGLFRTSNNGNNWEHTELPYSTYTTLKAASDIFAGTSNRVYKSTNSGLNWIEAHNGMTNIYTNVFSFLYSDTKLYAATSTGVYVSYNNGNNWDSLNSGLNGNSIYSITENNNTLFTGTQSNGIYKSTNFGITWVQSGLTGNTIHHLISINNTVLAATNQGVYKSTDNGLSWLSSNNGIGVQSINKFYYTGNKLFAGTADGVYLSYNNGDSWIAFNYGIETRPVKAICSNTSYMFAGAFASGVWRRQLSEIGIETIGSSIPAKYELSQNYPNPFNPKTNLRLHIPNKTFVYLRVYNILGKEVETVINKELKPGIYAVSWDASMYPSGLYFIQLTAESFSVTRKMILVK